VNEYECGKTWIAGGGALRTIDDIKRGFEYGRERKRGFKAARLDFAVDNSGRAAVFRITVGSGHDEQWKQRSVAGKCNDRREQ